MARKMGKLSQLIGNMFILILLFVTFITYYIFTFIVYFPKIHNF